MFSRSLIDFVNYHVLIQFIKLSFKCHKNRFNQIYLLLGVKISCLGILVWRSI